MGFMHKIQYFGQVKKIISNFAFPLLIDFLRP